MFAERLKIALKLYNLKKADVSRISGISKGQLTKYFKGESKPSVEVLIELAKALGVSTDFLLGLSDDPTPAIGNSNLNDKERDVIALWRQEKHTEAISIIANDSIK